MRQHATRPARFVLAGACAGAIVWTASVPRARTQAAPCTLSIHGHAVEDASHEPVAGATVTVDGRAAAITDEDGRFTLAGLCPGEVALEIGRDDLAPLRRLVVLARSRSMEFELTARLSEVIVIEGERRRAPDTRSTTEISGAALERTRGRGFSDTLAEVAGVSQLRSASGMAKPIVRGQFGRRLLLLVDSTRHRSQDWGLDHAPEIDPFIASRLTVVRGAAGVRYGPDAIGGAILVDPPALLRRPQVKGEVHLIGFDNRGGSLAGRLQTASARVPGLAWQIEGSAKRLRAPSAPDYPLDNTGSFEWNVGATAGFRGEDASVEATYRRYQARLGVCACLRIESSDDFFEQLDRQTPADADLYQSDFAIDRAFQAVSHDLGQLRGRWRLGDVGRLTATYALQFNHRREFAVVRDATGPQFDFRLTTHDLDLAFAHNPIHVTDHLHLRGSAGAVGMVAVHDYNGLTLVPDHRAGGGGVYVIERLLGHSFELEIGLRYDALTRTASLVRRDFLRLVRSGQLADNACGGGEGDPLDCDSTFHTLSVSAGGLWQLAEPLSVKIDLSTASRPPNPDEQYLNGTAPSFPVLALGKPDLGAETTYSASATASLSLDRLAIEGSIYGSYMADYIEFAPAIDENGEPIFDVLVRGSFPRFITRPVNAVFYGADGGVSARPIRMLELGAQVSIVRARNRTNDTFLSFVPPDRLRGSARVVLPSRFGVTNAFASVAGTFTARQRRFDLAADLAPPPAAHFLVDAEIGGERAVAGQTLKVALQGTNLTNQRYRDYTSLLRYFADQPGWQLMLRMSLHIATDPS